MDLINTYPIMNLRKKFVINKGIFYWKIRSQWDYYDLIFSGTTYRFALCCLLIGIIMEKVMERRL